MTIDRKVVLTGSMNFTSGAAQNSENVALIASEAVASSPRCPSPARGMVPQPRCGRAQIGIAAEMDRHRQGRDWISMSKLEAGGVADSPREFRSRNPVSPFGGEQVMEKRYSIPRN